MSTPGDDPRASQLESKFTLPNTWNTAGPDGYSATTMMFAGAVMVTRNRMLAWPALLLGLSAFVNQRPLRTKDASVSWQGLITGISALLMAYLPMFLISQPPPKQVPLSVNN